MEHQNLHFGNRPYACNLCDKKFAARSNLIQHRTVHKRPFNCNMCNKRFDREDQLKKHLFAHPQALLTCNFCQYAATSQADLNKHMVEHHPPQVLDTRGPASVKSENGEEQDKSAEAEAGKSPAASAGNGDFTATRDAATPHLMTHAIPPLNSPPPTVVHTSPQSVSVHSTPLPSPNQNNCQPPVSQFSPRSSSAHQSPESKGSKVDSICSNLSTSASSLPLPNHSPQRFAGSQLTAVNLPPQATLCSNLPVAMPPISEAFKGVIVKKEVEDYFDTPCSRPTSFAPMFDQSDRHSTSPRVLSRQNIDMGSSAGHPQTPAYPPADQARPFQVAPSNHTFSSAGQNFPPSPGVPNFASSFGPNSAKSPNPPGTPTLPAIHEVFSRRAQRIPPTFTNFGVPPMVSPDRTNASHNPSVSHVGDLPASLLSTPAPTSSAAASGSTGLPLPTVSTNPSTTRPTAQLPPIAQVLKHPKETVPQHQTQPPPGIPGLDEILSFYINQGKLFKCQHCNILFYERGMYFLHASLHGQSSPWECSICHKVCMDKNEFTIHFVNQQHNSQ